MNFKYFTILFLVSIVSVQCSKKTIPVVEAPADQSWRSAIPQPGPARTIELGDYQSFDLENGLKVIVVENHKLPRVSYQISLKNDPIIEGEKAGYVAMAGSLLSTGTQKRSKAEIDKATDFIGASINSSGSGMFGSSLTKHQGKLLDIMTEILYSPSFPEEEFDKLKTQNLSNLQAAKADPSSIAGNVSSIVNYGSDHPYGEIQTEKTIGNITLDDCKAYYNSFFKPNNAYLIIVGDISMAEARAKAEQYFSAWSPGDIPKTSYTSPPPPDENKVAFANKDGAVQAVIRVTHPVDLTPGHEDVVKVSVMNAILGGGVFLGRLMQNLREDKGFTYGARSNLSSDPLVSNFSAYASVRNEVADSAIVEFLYEINRIQTEPISPKDLQLAKNSMAGSFARGLESPQTLARFARNTFHYNLPDDYYATYLSRLEAITVADVQDVANKYLRPEKTNIIVVGSKDEIAEKMLPFDADGNIDYYDPLGAEINYDANVLPEGLTAEIVINDYIEAVGGVDAMKAVTSVKNEMKMSVMGQEAQVLFLQKAPDKFSISITLQGMTLQEQKFDGQKGLSAAMGNKQILTEGEEYESLKDQSQIFPQLSYTADMMELKGVEDVDGKKMYKLEITNSSGRKTIEFYDITTNLLARTSSSQQGPGGQNITTVTDIEDYKEIGGVLLPHRLTLSGAMPQPLTMESVNMEVNGPIDDAAFEIIE